MAVNSVGGAVGQTVAAGGSGTVTQIIAGTGLTGGTITTTGTIAVATPVYAEATAGLGYWLVPFGNPSLPMGANTSTVAAGAVRCGMIQLPYAITITKASGWVITTNNGNHEYVALYSADKTTKLLQVTFTMGAGTGALAGTLSPASVTLVPGSYWLAFSADNTTSVFNGATPPNGNSLGALNLSAVRWGVSDQVFAAGNMPAGLGTITSNAAVLPVVMFEP